MFTAEQWPIACNMLPFGNVAPDGSHIKDAPATVWASQMRQVRELGFDHIDPTDAWVPLGSMPEHRVKEFQQVLADEGLKVSSISMTRSSIVDVKHGEENLAAAHRLIDLAPEFGATIVNIGFMQALTAEQQKQLWFWLVDGHKDDPELRPLAIERTRELGEHAQRNGIQISLEMYEDTYVGTPDDAVSFVKDVNHPAVGLNPDIGNLIRLHRPMPPYMEMFEKVLPYSNFWHIKNYMRDEDPKTGSYASAPMPLKYGVINYRAVIRRALELGYSGPFCCEHYGSDSLGVCAENRDYIRQVLRSALSE
ncbi:sugar phosphate isomerase/epimerase family protein [Saccharomonospora viridis]|jgi:sugar phosphate isomerase/epimerase|uniref:Sugar phosphate isomerase/epimerase n=2 Tax=Saccharomonospora viridis TaxID=1852 RepID=C7MW82_SACVD|nr:sugar phosphate isomerase/epimerase family protein [Saccharomonospora viridis]ACU97851.1 sugar phosphate isomerase/epimerase [Saccharomonospora viridis DSM 43017]KHF45815.1 sugar phosphate isomerase [Saccharomonospora viridis]SFP42162.1 Sugar phosphate isomerase/epimerase [Saccharomonospora viridis]